jgi:general secretion pathway protein I
MNSRSRLAKHPFKSHGFTLIEVLVALLIVAVALSAAAKVMLGAAYSGAQRADRTAAQWVALNQMSILKLRREWPVNSESGTEEMMHRSWVWRQRAESTTDENVVRGTIDVYLEGGDEENSSASIVGFVANL